MNRIDLQRALAASRLVRAVEEMNVKELEWGLKALREAM